MRSRLFRVGLVVVAVGLLPSVALVVLASAQVDAALRGRDASILLEERVQDLAALQRLRVLLRLEAVVEPVVATGRVEALPGPLADTLRSPEGALRAIRERVLQDGRAATALGVEGIDRLPELWGLLDTGQVSSTATHAAIEGISAQVAVILSDLTADTFTRIPQVGLGEAVERIEAQTHLGAALLGAAREVESVLALYQPVAPPGGAPLASPDLIRAIQSSRSEFSAFLDTAELSTADTWRALEQERAGRIVARQQAAAFAVNDSESPGSTVLDPGQYAAAAFERVLDGIPVLDAAAADAVGSATEAHTQADEAIRRTIVAIVVVVAGTLVLTVVAGRSVVRPLGRLADRARRLSAGHLDDEALGPIGPRQVADLSVALDQLASSLNQVATNLDDLSSGTQPVLPMVAEGAVGAAAARAVARIQETTARLRRSEETVRSVMEAAAEGIVAFDRDGCVVLANRAAVALLDAGSSSLEGASLTRLLGSATAGMLLDAARAGRAVQIEASLGEGVEQVDLLLSISGHDRDDDQVTVVLRDITERKRMESLLRNQASTDALTGVANRLGFMTWLAERRSQPGVFLMLVDLDRFKAVNDTLGHGAGDEVLRVVADRLTRFAGPGDVVARLGGDEFVLGSDVGIDEEAVELLGTAVIRAIEEPIDVGERAVEVSASVGVALGTIGGGSASDRDEMLRRADLALYHSKRQCRGAVSVCDDALWAAQDNVARMELALRRALRNGELRLVYQPIVDLVTGVTVGAEALCRWTEDGDEIGPDVFVPIAERSSLGAELGRWVLDQACRDLVVLREQGVDLQWIGVNISWVHAAGGGLADDVVHALRAHGVEPEALTLELTERSEDFVLPSAGTLRLLRELGVRLSLDDFGGGASSLTTLRLHRFDSMKIERSFVADDPESRTIVRSIAALGSSLGLSVVAEGIETEAQLALVREAGCRYGQGYLLGLPLDREEFTAAVAPTLAKR